MKRKNAWAMAFAGLTLMFMACTEEKPATDENAESTDGDKVATVDVNYNIDVENSTVTWKGEMLGMYTHEGTINISQGGIIANGDEISVAKVSIDMSSIMPTDDGFDEERTPDKLIGHLSSEVFFSVEAFPYATFVLDSVEDGVGTGTLTIRGNSNSESLTDVVMTEADGTVTITGNITFDRKNYEVAFVNPVKDKVISDDIQLSFSIVGTSK